VQGNPNNFEESFSQFGHRHRITGSANYRHAWTDMFATSFGLFLEVAEGGFFSAGRTSRYSYTVSGDLNGDGVSGNDLIYVPRDQSEINLVDIPGGLSAAQQWTALNAFIEQDEYLSEHRGEITERNGAINPWFTNLDLRVLQDVIVSDHTFQVSLDVLNLGNFLNSDWGVREVVNTAAKTPLIVTGFNAAGQPLYQFPGTVSETFIDDPSELSRRRAVRGLRRVGERGWRGTTPPRRSGGTGTSPARGASRPAGTGRRAGAAPRGREPRGAESERTGPPPGGCRSPSRGRRTPGRAVRRR
jgi:hypothetical protein